MLPCCSWVGNDSCMVNYDSCVVTSSSFGVVTKEIKGEQLMGDCFDMIVLAFLEFGTVVIRGLVSLYACAYLLAGKGWLSGWL